MSSGGGETTQTTEPWGGVKPYLKDIYARVGGTGAGAGGLPMAPGAAAGLPANVQEMGGQYYRARPVMGQEIEDAYARGETPPSGYELIPPDELARMTGGGGGGAPGLIDQPLPIFDPVDFTAPETLAQQRMLQAGGAPVPGLFGQAQDALGATVGGEYLTPEALLGPGAGSVVDASQGEYLTPGGILGEAAPEVMQTMGGDYLGANPYLEGMYQAASRPVVEDFTEQVLPALTGQFAAAGRGSSGMQQSVQQGATEDLTRNLSDMASRLYGGAYESERGRMMQAANLYGGAHGAERGRMLQSSGLLGDAMAGERGRMMQSLGMAPDIAAAPGQYEAWQAGMLGDVGLAQRELMEARRAAEEARAREPWERMQLAAQLYGAGSPFTTQSQPFYRNRAAGALGGAASGAAMGAGAGPWGALIGAGIGGVAGYAGS